MFGIKTAKDKLIDEKDKLIDEQAEYIKTLETILKAKPLTENVVKVHEKAVINLGAEILLEDGMPVSFAKAAISRKLAEKLEEFIIYDAHDCEYNRIITGRLSVIDGRS